MQSKHVQRIVQYGVFLLFVSVTLAAFYYTLFGRKVAFLPWTMVRYSYGMMAPFYGFNERNQDFLVEGKLLDGSWEAIAWEGYFPVRKGERTIRYRLGLFEKHPGVWYRKQTELAHRLWSLESAKEKDYRGIRVLFQTWPKSPDGYEANRVEPLIDSQVVIELP